MDDHTFTFLVGAAQRSIRTDDVDHPAALMVDIARAALADAGIDDAALLDGVACVEPIAWTYTDLVGDVAGGLGCRSDVARLGVPAGGTSPQDLLHQIAATPTLDCVVLVGAEPVRARRRAAPGAPAGWPPRDRTVDPLRGQPPFSSPVERLHGLVAPIQVFPLYENAIRAATRRTFDDQRGIAADLLARNARVAAANPHAWFHDAPDAEAIAAVTPANRMIAYPYTKRMNAILDVNQAAAVVVVSQRFATAHGLLDRAAAVLGGAGAADAWNPIERATFSESPAMNLAVATALHRAGLNAADIDAADLYSCFPSAIQLGLTAMGADHTDPRPVSLTGGLAFAGGPGNGYVLHSLAAALAHLRAEPSHRLLITGIGMANTKQAATILTGATHIPTGATGETSYREPIDTEPREVDTAPDGEATIVTYTIEYDRDGAPCNVIVILDRPDGRRTIANAADTATLAAELMASEPIGRAGHVEHDETSGRNFFRLTERERPLPRSRRGSAGRTP